MNESSTMMKNGIEVEQSMKFRKLMKFEQWMKIEISMKVSERIVSSTVNES